MNKEQFAEELGRKMRAAAQGKAVVEGGETDTNELVDISICLTEKGPCVQFGVRQKAHFAMKAMLGPLWEQYIMELGQAVARDEMLAAAVKDLDLMIRRKLMGGGQV